MKERNIEVDVLFIKVTANLRGCPREKNSYSRCLQENLHKLYINIKAMKCRIREK